MYELDTGHNPANAAYCPDEECWNDFVKFLGMEETPYPDTPGCVSTFTYSGQPAIMVMTFNFDGASEVQKFGVVVHECVHIWQGVLEAMNEQTGPGREVEAYFIQGLTLQVLDVLKEEGQINAP